MSASEMKTGTPSSAPASEKPKDVSTWASSRVELFWLVYAGLVVANALLIFGALLGPTSLVVAITVPIVGVVLCVAWGALTMTGLDFLSFFLPSRNRPGQLGWAGSIQVKWAAVAVVLVMLCGHVAVMVSLIIAAAQAAMVVSVG